LLEVVIGCVCLPRFAAATATAWGQRYTEKKLFFNDIWPSFELPAPPKALASDQASSHQFSALISRQFSCIYSKSGFNGFSSKVT
jgi:hypothetical protein